MIWKILCLIMLGFWALCNLIIALYSSVSSMISDLWNEQSIVGKIFANIFYAPAWILKTIYCIWRRVHKKIKKFIFPFG